MQATCCLICVTCGQSGRADFDKSDTGVVEGSSLQVQGDQKLPFKAKAYTSNEAAVSNDCKALNWGSDPAFGPNGYHHLTGEPVTERGLVLPYTEFGFDEDTACLRKGSSVGEKRAHDPGTLKAGSWSSASQARRKLLHIIAERNRRLKQNGLYQQLHKLVPSLTQEPRLSKRDVLARTADWLNGLIQDNKILHERLRRIKLCQEHEHANTAYDSNWGPEWRLCYKSPHKLEPNLGGQNTKCMVLDDPSS
ncbi:hypothetical protein BJY01DRAFT_255295 [Aspergillus pseudoustus]|uniref:BHLH domain-containing protein n=1 Tax=Aspergillus pseudoustus TaxID=1810923 RepID=A0ABR4ILE9_9EURO